MKFLQFLFGVILLIITIAITIAIADHMRYGTAESLMIPASLGLLILAWIFCSYSKYGEFIAVVLNLIVWGILALMATFCTLFLAFALFAAEAGGVFGLVAAIVALGALWVFGVCVDDVKRLAGDFVRGDPEQKTGLQKLKAALEKVETGLTDLKMDLLEDRHQTQAVVRHVGKMEKMLTAAKVGPEGEEKEQAQEGGRQQPAKEEATATSQLVEKELPKISESVATPTVTTDDAKTSAPVATPTAIADEAKTPAPVATPSAGIAPKTATGPVRKAAAGPMRKAAALVRKAAAKPVYPVKKVLEKKGDAASLEAFIGTKLLSYSGIVILVLGFAFLLVYSLTRMGPGGRTAVGFCLSALLLVLGRYLERDPRYLMFGRVLMAGGWATLYFTSFGAHHIDAMKVIDSPVLGTLLLAAVAVSIITHAMKYASEAVTGVALFLAYLTLFVSEISLYTHIAALILAVLISVFVCKFRWIATQLIGMLLLYLGYGIWLYVQDAKYTSADSGSYLLATCLLVGLWASFKAPEFTRGIYSWENRAFLVSGIMNVSCLALVRKLAHLSFEKTGEPYSALALCAVYLMTGQVLRWRKRVPVYYLDSTIATVLVMFGLWFALGRLSSCMTAWLVWATILFSYSLLRTERYFRDMGNIVAILATLVVLGGELPHRFVHFCYNLFTGELFFGGGTPLPVREVITPVGSGFIAVLGSFLLYLGAFVVWSRFKRAGEWVVDEVSRDRAVNIIATLTAMAAFYKMLSPLGCAYAWMIFGSVLFQYGLYRNELYLRLLSHLVLLWCACSGSLLGLSTAQIGVSLAVTASLIYLDGYLTYALIPKDRLSELEELLERALTVAGTLAMMVAASCLFGEFTATLFWLALGAALFYYGMGRRDDFLRMVSHLVVLSAASRASLAAFNGQDLIVLAGNWRASSAVINMLGAVALYYLHARLARLVHSDKSEKWYPDEEAAVVTAANVILCLLLWFTLPPIAIAIAYALCGLIFLRCSQAWRLSYLRIHSNIALILSGIWLLTVNLGASGYVGGISRSFLSCLPPLTLWLYAGFLWRGIPAESHGTPPFPSVLSYMSFAAVVSLIHVHMPGYAAWWAIYALVLLCLGHYLRHSRYAVQTLIAMTMAGCNICAVAGRAAGDPVEYFLENYVLILVPAAMFAAHALSRIYCFDTPCASSPPRHGDENPFGADSLEGSAKGDEVHTASRVIYALYFNLAAAVVLTLVLPSSLYSLAWGGQALFAGWYGLTFREQIFRWLSLILFGLAILKIVFYDVFFFSAEERIFTFIAVGVALLAVSFLYNRLKDQLLRFLQED